MIDTETAQVMAESNAESLKTSLADVEKALDAIFIERESLYKRVAMTLAFLTQCETGGLSAVSIEAVRELLTKDV